jgi:hypothetical protein
MVELEDMILRLAREQAYLYNRLLWMYQGGGRVTGHDLLRLSAFDLVHIERRGRLKARVRIAMNDLRREGRLPQQQPEHACPSV